MAARAGAIDLGRIYEQKAAALFAIRCALNPLVTDFWIASNAAKFGDFDDVVLLLENSEGSKVVYCVQLKHVETRGLQPCQLEDNNGKFCLKKYLDSYKSIKKNIKKNEILDGIDMDQIHFIMYTNASLSGKEKATVIEIENKDGIDFFVTSSRRKTIYQISNKEGTAKPLDEHFLQRFSLYTDQATASDLDRLIKNEFDSYFDDISNTVIVTITDYFVKWAVSKKLNRLFKKDVQLKLLEYLLQPHVIEPKHSAVRDSSILRLLNDTLVSFNIVPVRQKTSLDNIFASVEHVLQETCNFKHDIQLSWNTKLTDKQHNTLKSKDNETKQQIHKILKERHQFVAHLTVKDLYLSAWQCKMIPLIVSCELSFHSIQKILAKFEEVTRSLSFVLLHPKHFEDLEGKLKIFNSFNDIDNLDLFNRNLDNTYISLQGKGKLSLKEFKKNADVLGEVTPDLYSTLLNGVLQLGKTYDVENYYIKRSLKRPRVSFDVLNEENASNKEEANIHQKGNLFLLVEYTNSQYIPYEYKKNALDLSLYLKSLVSGGVNETKYILTTNLPPTDYTLKVIVSTLYREVKKALHVLKIEHSSLEWLYSEGPIDILHDYVEDSILSDDSGHGFIHEDTMLQYFQSHINIISNNAGMGKTFMLNSLANKFDPGKWVSLMSLSEHMPNISQLKEAQPNDYIHYINEWQINMNDPLIRNFCTRVIRDRWNSANVIWLLDGYDEVSSEEILHFLTQVRNFLNIKIWITTRPTYNKELEGIMGALSLELTHFKGEDHVTFLWKYFETFNDIYGYNNTQIQYIIDTISKCSKALDKTFIAIPLQTRMFAEIFGDDINQISEKERLTIIDLYNKFIDIKLKEYKSYEATSLKKTLSKLALKLFFTEDQLDDLLDFDELREEAQTFKESYKKDSIVIGLDERGDAVFGHRTFAEFLAAYWLTKQITRKGKYNLDWRPLVEKLFYVDMISIRVFFDRILCQDLPLHLALLNNDMDNVQLLLNEENSKTQVDKLGRSALHLAVSYGEYYDLYVSANIKGIRAVGLHTIIKDAADGVTLEIPKFSTQIKVPTTVVDELLNRGFINNCDILFEYDAFDYAMKSCSLGALNCLFKKLDKDSLLFESEYNFKVFLYCVIYDNLHHVLSKRKSYDFDTRKSLNHQLRKMFAGYNFRLLGMKYNKYYLTEVASYNGGKETVFELLQTGKLHVEDGNPLHRACFNGHHDVVELLYKMGADVRKMDENGWSPIYQSGLRGRSDITYTFLKSDIYRENILTKVTKMTPMHYVCQGGHLECAKKLLEYGAGFLEVDIFSNTPLYYAAIYGHIDLLAFLIKTLTEDQKKDKRVHSVLTVAASKGYPLEKLIACGLDVNFIDDQGNTPLILACKNGFPKVIEELAQTNCDLNQMKTNENRNSVLKEMQLHNIDFSVKLVTFDLDKSAKGGLSPLYFAVLGGHVDCVSALVACGSDKTIGDTIGFGYSPLIWASISGRYVITETLLSAKSNPEWAQKDLEDSEIALIWASILGHDECVDILLRYVGNADNLQSGKNQERLERILQSEYGTDYIKVVRPIGEVNNFPLVLAAINNRASTIRVLMSKNYKRNQGDLNIALFFASKKGYLETIKVLLEYGADEHSKNERMMPALPIVWASMNGRTDLVKFFLSTKSKDYCKEEDVLIALNFAATNGHTECVKVLLDFGFDINHVYAELTAGTPLVNACEYYGNSEVIKFLLSRKCDIHAKNSDGETALDILAHKKKFDLVKLLLDLGALQSKAEEGSKLYEDLQEAMSWAVASQDTDLVYKLVELGIKEKEK